MILRILSAIALAAALAAPAGALAQKYPDKTVRLVLPFTAASAVDVLARLYAQKMSDTWGQQILVDNRTGASGIIGMEAIAKGPPDGYTLGMGNLATLALNPNLYARLPYDVLAGQVPMIIAGLVSALPHHQSGRQDTGHHRGHAHGRHAGNTDRRGSGRAGL